MDVSYCILPSGISISFGGKAPAVIPRDDERFEQIIEAIRNNELEKIPEIVESVNNYFINIPGVEFNNGLIKIDGDYLPPVLNRYIIDLVEDNIPFDRIIKFWRRLNKNPSYGVRERLFAFMQRAEHPITEDGRFIAYKRVKKNEQGVLVDCHTGKMENKIGTIVSMPREKVDDNPNNLCSAGLHVAGFRYANNFYANGVLLECVIAPEDVVSVPIEYGDEKMRTCKYEVLAEISAPREESYVDIYESDSSDEEDDDYIEDEEDDYYAGY